VVDQPPPGVRKGTSARRRAPASKRIEAQGLGCLPLPRGSAQIVVRPRLHRQQQQPGGQRHAPEQAAPTVFSCRLRAKARQVRHGRCQKKCCSHGWIVQRPSGAIAAAPMSAGRRWFGEDPGGKPAVWKRRGGGTFHLQDDSLRSRCHEPVPPQPLAVEASQGVLRMASPARTLPPRCRRFFGSGRRGGMVRHRQLADAQGQLRWPAPSTRIVRREAAIRPISKRCQGLLRRTQTAAGEILGSAGPQPSWISWSPGGSESAARVVSAGGLACCGGPGCPGSGRGRPSRLLQPWQRGQVVAAVAIAEEDPVDRLGRWARPAQQAGRSATVRAATRRRRPWPPQRLARCLPLSTTRCWSRRSLCSWI